METTTRTLAVKSRIRSQRKHQMDLSISIPACQVVSYQTARTATPMRITRLPPCRCCASVAPKRCVDRSRLPSLHRLGTPKRLCHLRPETRHLMVLEITQKSVCVALPTSTPVPFGSEHRLNNPRRIPSQSSPVEMVWGKSLSQ